MSLNEKPIVFISHWAAALGGAEYSLLDILAYCTPKTRCVLITSEEGLLADRARLMGVDVRIIAAPKAFSSISRNISFARFAGAIPAVIAMGLYCAAVYATVAKISPRIIHSNVPKSHLILSLLRLFGYAGPAVFHLREIFGRFSVARFVFSVCAYFANGKILAISHAVKNSLPGFIKNGHRCTVIHNGISIPTVAPIHPDSATIRFIYLGRIVPWKGCHLLCTAFSLALSRCPVRAATLSLIGDTRYWSQRYRAQLQEQIDEAGLQSVCTLQPHTEDLQTAYRTHHVFCTASTDEPFGRSVAEALAYGLPVVAFEGGGIPEIVTNDTTGVLVPPGDVERMSAAMFSFINHPQRIQSMGEAGRVYAAKNFNKDIQLKKFWKIIERESSNNTM